MKTALYYLVLISLVICLLIPYAAAAEQTFPGAEWDTIKNPAEMSWSLEKVAIAQKYADGLNAVGGLVIYDGKILFKWGILPVEVTYILLEKV